MRILHRYIARRVLSAIALVTLILIGLQIFILFVNQIDNFGKPNFNIWRIAAFVFLEMPYQVYLFFPLACLLGSLIGLGIMANNYELVVMRAAGISVVQIAFSIFKAAALVIILVTFLGESIVPRLAHLARDQKMSRNIEISQTLRTAYGVWLRNKNNFITIGTVYPNNILENVYQFHFDEQYSLSFVRKIQRLIYNQNRWLGFGVEESKIRPDKITSSRKDEIIWDVAVKPDILRATTNDPEELTLLELRQYLRAQKNNRQSLLSYRLAYWQRLVQPLTTIVMMGIAIPFIFGPLRSSTMGARLLFGACIGFSFHIINRFFGAMSQILQWPIELAALGPTSIFALIGLYLMRRVK